MFRVGTAIALIGVCVASGHAGEAPALVKKATAALRARDLVGAKKLVDAALQDDPKSAPAYVLRAAIAEAQAASLSGKAHADALTSARNDLSLALAIDPDDAESLQSRGSLRFRLGDVDGSLVDFDAYLVKRPNRKASHWQRGISCYYAAKFDEGRKQFEVYQDFDSADVENAVWRFMCMAKKDGVGAAQKAILKIGDDRRVPMRQVYDLFAGTKTPADVLAAAEAAGPADGAGNAPRFYAHLYLGIWHDLAGDRGKALEHLDLAADRHRIGHYMWDVARVHRDRLKSAK